MEGPPLQYVGTVDEQKVLVFFNTGGDDVFVNAALVRKSGRYTYQPSAHTVRLADGSVGNSHTVARIDPRCVYKE
jgi:hypothetical protein